MYKQGLCVSSHHKEYVALAQEPQNKEMYLLKSWGHSRDKQ